MAYSPNEPHEALRGCSALLAGLSLAGDELLERVGVHG